MLAVAANIIGAGIVICMVMADFVHLLQVVAQVLLSAETLAERRIEILLTLIEVVDQGLLAGVLLIFGMGLYELYISKIDAAEGYCTQSKLLIITSIDQLKSKLGSLIIMILVVKFFSYSLSLKVTTPEDMLMYAASVALLGAALFLTNSKRGNQS